MAETPTIEQRPHWMDMEGFQIWVLPNQTLSDASVKQVEELLSNDAEIDDEVMRAYRKTINMRSN